MNLTPTTRPPQGAEKALKHPESGVASELAPDTITVLFSLEGTASKRFYRDNNGVVQSEPYNAETWFDATVCPVSSLADLSEVLLMVEKYPRTLVIRGAPLPKKVHQLQRIRRLNINFETPTAGLRWVLIDFDKTDMPPGMRFDVDRGAALEYLVSLLPEEFHDCSYHYQLSSSAGVKDEGKLKAHIWFWLTEPWTNLALKSWAGAVNTLAGCKLIDLALFQDVQAHYTAAPVFGPGVEDPFPVRSGLIQKATDAVTIRALPVSETAPKAEASERFETGIGFEGWMALMGDHEGGGGFLKVILRATASYASTTAVEDRDAEALLERIQSAVRRADHSAHRPEEIDARADRKYIMPMIKSAFKNFQPRTIRRKTRYVEGLEAEPAGAELSAMDGKIALSVALKAIIGAGGI